MRRLDEALIHKVVELEKDGMKRRAIARALKVSRNTVRIILVRQREGRELPHSALVVPSLVARPSKLDIHRPRVENLLKTYEDITAQRVFEILRDENAYGGGYSIVKELVRKLRPKEPPKPSLETPPRVPGDMAECDWSSYPVTFTHAPPMLLQAFGYALRWSTRKYFGFHEGQWAAPIDGRPCARFRALRGRSTSVQV